jgi:hypothetical protein
MLVIQISLMVSYNPMMSLCEYNNEVSGSTKIRNFFDHPNITLSGNGVCFSAQVQGETSREA